jgi:hypothetical protein
MLFPSWTIAQTVVIGKKFNADSGSLIAGCLVKLA